jgi:23S rRNA (adenine2503-C2)-methyltransferase
MGATTDLWVQDGPVRIIPVMKERESIAGLLPEEFRARVAALGLPAYRAGQVLRWLYRRGATSFDEMTDLPGPLRRTLAEPFDLLTTRVVDTHEAADETAKLLVELADGHLVETVIIPHGARRTACISTSVGCAYRCAFCASGRSGLQRLLTAGEMVEQVLHAARPAALTNLVVMGIGEPLVDVARLERFLRIINGREALAFGARRITISTVGLPAGIRALAALGIQVNLAVSLHAPDDALRDQLVPANRGVGITAVLDAAADYFERTGRRVTYEYCLLAGVNDSDDLARRLAKRLRRAPGLVNVIPYNAVPGSAFHAPSAGRVARFVEVLRSEGLEVQARQSRGGPIQAACGQLRADRLRRRSGGGGP